VDESLRKIAFAVENRTADAHKTGLRLSAPAGFAYELLRDGQRVPLVATGDWDYPLRAVIEIEGPAVKVEVVRKGVR